MDVMFVTSLWLIWQRYIFHDIEVLVSYKYFFQIAFDKHQNELIVLLICDNNRHPFWEAFEKIKWTKQFL